MSLIEFLLQLLVFHHKLLVECCHLGILLGQLLEVSVLRIPDKLPVKSWCLVQWSVREISCSGYLMANTLNECA